MKKLFKRKKKSLGDVGSLASGRSASGYNVSPKKDLHKIHKAAFDNDIAKLKSLLKREDINQLDKENRLVMKCFLVSSRRDHNCCLLMKLTQNLPYITWEAIKKRPREKRF